MASTRGRQVVLPLTNKSGGSVAAGDLVVVDTSNDAAFTTTTAGRAETSLGVAQEAIASNAAGRVLVAGYAALVNVPSSMTRGYYVETHSVVKQGTGSSSRRSGSFGQFLTGGSTPSAWLWGSTDQTAAAAAASGIIGSAFLQHASVDTTVSGFGTSVSDMDATNLAATFTVPASGNVAVTVECMIAQSTTVTTLYIGFREATTLKSEAIGTQGSGLVRVFARWQMTGLTPGASTTYKATIRKATSGTGNFYHGPTYGPTSIVIQAL